MITNSEGKTVSARNTILILTSNLGARDAERNTIGFGNNTNTSASDEAVKRFFSPEFRNRLDAIVTFRKLDKELMHNVTIKFLKELDDMLKPRNIEFTFDEDALEWLTTNGFTESMGARPMARLINEKVKKPLAKELLFGDNITTVQLVLENDTLCVRTS